jgi:hypothetical protein
MKRIRFEFQQKERVVRTAYIFLCKVKGNSPSRSPSTEQWLPFLLPFLTIKDVCNFECCAMENEFSSYYMDEFQTPNAVRLQPKQPPSLQPTFWPNKRTIETTGNFQSSKFLLAGKVKFSLQQAMKAQRGSRCIALLFL